MDLGSYVQEAMTIPIPKKIKCKKAKCLFEEILQIAEANNNNNNNLRKEKGKGQGRMYT